jgi:hypothetical protein
LKVTEPASDRTGDKGGRSSDRLLLDEVVVVVVMSLKDDDEKRPRRRHDLAVTPPDKDDDAALGWSCSVEADLVLRNGAKKRANDVMLPEAAAAAVPVGVVVIAVEVGLAQAMARRDNVGSEWDRYPCCPMIDRRLTHPKSSSSCSS